MPLTLSRSYLCGEQDICPECYSKPGANYPADAELQREGAPVVAQVGLAHNPNPDADPNPYPNPKP